MFNKHVVILFALVICSRSFYSVDSASSGKQLSQPESRLEKRGLLPLSNTVENLLDVRGLSALKSVLQQLQVSNLLDSTVNLVDTIASLPINGTGDPVKAYESLYNNSAEVVENLQQLAVGKLTCTGCWFLVGLIRFLQALQVSDDAIADAVIKVCVEAKIQTPRVCNGVIDNYKTMILYSLKNTPYNIMEICGFLVGYGCGTEPEQCKWKLTLPGNKPPVTPVVSPQPGANQLKILHMTDQHIDWNYTAGSPSGCKEPLCCHADSPADSPNSLGGEYGGLLHCDIPMRTMELMLDDSKSKCENPDFIIWNGDQPAHDVWTETPASHMAVNAAVVNKLKEKFPNVQVFPAIGNHESAPVNNFPMPTSQIPAQYHTDWLYNHMADLWGSWLTPASLETVRK